MSKKKTFSDSEIIQSIDPIKEFVGNNKCSIKRIPSVGVEVSILKK